MLLVGLLLVPANAADTLEDTPPEAYAALFTGELENNAVEATPQKETTLLEGKSIAWHLNPAGQALFLPHIAQWLEEQTKEKVLIAGFRDVKRQDWYADTVEYMVGTGLMMGTGNDTFSPEEAMTRGMLIAVLYRAAGYPDVAEGEMPFADVRPGTYYYDAVQWGYQQGVIYGVDETHFNPDQNLTREQMTSILYRWWNSAHSATEKDENPEILEAFSDERQISGYARLGMAWAVEHGIVYGTGGRKLEPQSNATRSQAAAMLLRYWTNSDLQEPEPSEPAGQDGTIDE